MKNVYDMLADFYEQKARANDEEWENAEASGNLMRMALANRYNGDKVMAMMYRRRADLMRPQRSESAGPDL